MKQMECVRFLVNNSTVIKPRFDAIKTSYNKARIYIEASANTVIMPDIPEEMCTYVADITKQKILEMKKFDSDFPYTVENYTRRVLDEILNDLFSIVISSKLIKKKLIPKMKHCAQSHIRDNVEKTCELILRLYKYSFDRKPENIKIIVNALELALKGSL